MQQKSGENISTVWDFSKDHSSELVKRGEQKSFIEFLHLAAISAQDRTSVEQSSDFSKISNRNKSLIILIE